MLGYILSVLTERPLVIDSYEPHAEAMVENGEWKKNGLRFTILFFFEKLQTHRAKFLIGTTEAMRSYAREKFGHQKENFYVKPACVDLELFKVETSDKELIKRFDLENKVVAVYAGKFGGIYLEDEVFEFVRVCCDYWKDRFRFLLLSNAPDDYIKEKSKIHGIPCGTIRKTFVPHEKMNVYLNLAQFALCPVKPVPSKRYCSPIKNGEYWATGLPVVITNNISDDSTIIEKNNIGYVLKNLNKKEYREAAEKIDNLLKETNITEKIRETAITSRNFRVAEIVYKTIYSENSAY
jgi:glycosyltransferase involved in cell wall biosynthesis